MHIGTYIRIVHRSEADLAKALDKVAVEHGQEVDIMQTCKLLAKWSREMEEQMEPFINKYKDKGDDEPDRLTNTLIKSPRTGGLALLRDLHDLYLIATEVSICCTIVKQGATALRDRPLMEACDFIAAQTKRQLSWLQTRMKSATPQTLVVG